MKHLMYLMMAAVVGAILSAFCAHLSGHGGWGWQTIMEFLLGMLSFCLGYALVMVLWVRGLPL